MASALLRIACLRAGIAAEAVRVRNLRFRASQVAQRGETRGRGMSAGHDLRRVGARAEFAQRPRPSVAIVRANTWDGAHVAATHGKLGFPLDWWTRAADAWAIRSRGWRYDTAHVERWAGLHNSGVML